MRTATLPSTGSPSRAVARHDRRRWWKVVGSLTVAASLVFYLGETGSGSGSAIAALRTASPGWIALGLLATVASMVAFSVTRAATLSAAGQWVGLGEVIAISYAAGALHVTVPGGTLFSSGYVFRQLRRLGTSPASAAWSMTISGVLSTITLAVLGLSGLMVVGSGAGASIGIFAGAAAIVAALVITRLLQNPDACATAAQRVLIRINRLRRAPAESGSATLNTTIQDMRKVRPSRRSWAVSLAAASANWLLDLLCLDCAAVAIGVHVSVPALIVTYVAGMTTAGALPLPGGIGGVETAMVLGLTVAGAASAPALAAVLLYRLLSTGSVVIFGWITVAARARRVTQTAVVLSAEIDCSTAPTDDH